MNKHLLVFVKNFGYSIFANVISLLISVTLVVILPKAIGVEDYGYWQLYLFYVSYIGFFHLGWSDGVYLRIGGNTYDNLDKKVINTQFWYLTIMQIIIMLLIGAVIIFFIKDANKLYILILTILNCIFMVPKAFLVYVLQATNRIKEYSVVTIVEKIVYCITIISVLLFGIRNYRVLILCDILAKVVSSILSIIYCKDIFTKGITTISDGIKEAILNISIGIKLMVANIAGMLILGVIRMGIENKWSIETFGKISLSLSVSNMMMVFINAIGVVLFPMLRRTDKEKLGETYTLMRTILMVILFIAIIAYYPLKPLLSLWLPQYEEGLKYMALMFPVCIFEGKISMLINTYLKTLRREKVMLLANCISFALACISTWICIYLLGSLNLTVVMISLLFAFRSIISEIFVGKSLNMKFTKDILLEVSLSVLFMVFSWYLDPFFGFVCYSFCLILYLFLKRKDIIFTINRMKTILKKT